MGASWAGHAGSCLVLFVVCDHAERSAAPHPTHERQPVREPIQPCRVQCPNGPTLVPDMTGLSAGGLRSRRSAKARIRQTNRYGGVGTDFTL